MSCYTVWMFKHCLMLHCCDDDIFIDTALLKLWYIALCPVCLDVHGDALFGAG